MAAVDAAVATGPGAATGSRTQADRAAAGGQVTRALASALAFTLVSLVVTTWLVHRHYLQHLPHFDSIGSYFNAYGVVNALERDGLLAGLAQATSISLGWLQPLYALMLASVGLPARSPEWLVSLNFVLMALTQAAIGVWCRDFGYGWRQATVLMLLPYLPGAFYAWDGGLQDWRRDIQLNVLLIGVLFLSLAYVLRPTLRKGLGLGLLLGLSQWARDNAVAMLVVTVAPAALLVLGQAIRERRWLAPVARAVPPLAVFVLLAVPYYVLTLQTTIARYLYSVWGPGEDRWASLRQFWSSPVDVLLGGTYAFNGEVATGRATLAGLAALAVLLAAVTLAGLVRISPAGPRAPRALVLLGSGLLVMVGVIVYNTLGLGYGAQYHGMPFVPVATGLVALAAGFSDLFQPGRDLAGRGPMLRTAALALAMAAFVGLNAYRVEGNQRGAPGPDVVAAVRDASLLIAERAGARPVAVLWLDGFSRYHITYYQLQAGQPRLEAVATNIDAPLRAGQRAEDVLEPIERQVANLAAVVVLCEDTSRYANPSAVNPMFQQGKPLADRILASPDFEPIHRFTVGSAPLVVLQRRARG